MDIECIECGKDLTIEDFETAPDITQVNVCLSCRLEIEEEKESEINYDKTTME